MTTVLLVDDQDLIRAGVRVILDAHADIEVIGEAGEGITALDILRRTAVDVVLMDLDMPGINGVETTRRIREQYGPDRPRILVLTTFDHDENVLAALRAGADGFLSKGASPSEIAEAIRRVAGGGRALSTSAIDALVGHLAEPAVPPSDPQKEALFAQLTPRELEVVRLVVRGLDNAEIGRQIFISPYTVKTHANRAMMKVGARDRAHLVSLAVLAGIRP
ncbi:response regulator transcription factor [Agromyces atrinae]|uniref:response regulator n=1 Tax=Agromyces atrinae TaxID=592376 RepID=UPI001F584585|nr:response regulator transcription factor [Agromyces atrinae]MCI2956869.1 response regulator transcription factor [Agromyces atrinae]